MEDSLKSVAQHTLQYAIHHGVQVEVYASSQRELQIEAANKRVETLKEATESGLAVRVVNAGRLGFAYTSDLKPTALREAVDAAMAASDFMPRDEHLRHCRLMTMTWGDTRWKKRSIWHCRPRKSRALLIGVSHRWSAPFMMRKNSRW